jgi:molecular chaperone GrpE
MTDTEQTIEEQPGSPGADAPGEGVQRSEEAETLAPETPPETDGDAAEMEDDLGELVKTAAQRDEYLALAQRTQADFENYRKRVARESAAAQGRGVASLAKELLPALDNLDRALEAAAQDDPLLEGVRLVRSELDAALARVGIESFSPVGESFDPALHEAMATIEQPVDGAESGTVVEVYQPGYRLGASIIRPARVVVAA